MSTISPLGRSEGCNFMSEVNFIPCEKCKSNEFTKQCFAPDCDKVRCARCVINLCQKNSKAELKDDDGELIYICTKVSPQLTTARLPTTTHTVSHYSTQRRRPCMQVEVLWESEVNLRCWPSPMDKRREKWTGWPKHVHEYLAQLVDERRKLREVPRWFMQSREREALLGQHYQWANETSRYSKI